MTRISTLTNFHDQNPHALGAMFSGKYLLKPDINDDEYFIDRDGEYFKYILSILRDGPEKFVKRLSIFAADTIMCLENETQYFGLYDLVFGKHKPKLNVKPISIIDWNPSWRYKGLSQEKFSMKKGTCAHTDYIPNEVWKSMTICCIEFTLTLSGSKSEYSCCYINLLQQLNTGKNIICRCSIGDQLVQALSDKSSNNSDIHKTRNKFKITINTVRGLMEIDNQENGFSFLSIK